VILSLTKICNIIKSILTKRALAILLMFFLIIILFPCISFAQEDTKKNNKEIEIEKIIIISGKVLDYRGEPVPSAEVKLLLTDKAGGIEYEDESEAFEDGSYSFEIEATRELVEQIDSGYLKIVLKVSKIAFASISRTLTKIRMAKQHGRWIFWEEVKLRRSPNAAFYISVFILLLVFILISMDVIHRTGVALLGVALLFLITYTLGIRDPNYYIISFERAVQYIDLNVILLLMGMMIIVAILEDTGIFKWLSIRSFELSGGSVVRLSLILVFITAIFSALLDNVTTMIIMTIITIEISLSLEIDPLSLLIPQIFASNIGGAATLIGDSTNVIIGSSADLSFGDFIKNMTPIAIINIFALIVITYFYYKNEYREARVKDAKKFIKELEKRYKITDKELLIKSTIIFLFVVVMFFIQDYLDMPSSVAALMGAGILLAWARADVIKKLEKVEWSTLLFLMMLFIIVGAVKETGFIDAITELIANFSRGNIIYAIILIIWVTAIMSTIIDNVPFIIAMLPVVKYLTNSIPGAENMILYWALSLGGCLGGNGSITGSSASMVTVGLAERLGYPIKFKQFLKKGLPVMLITIAISSLYLLFIHIL